MRYKDNYKHTFNICVPQHKYYSITSGMVNLLNNAKD